MTWSENIKIIKILWNKFWQTPNLWSLKEVDLIRLVNVDINARDVTVKGPLGTLKRSFKHSSCDIFKKKSAKGTKVHVQSN